MSIVFSCKFDGFCWSGIGIVNFIVGIIEEVDGNVWY